MGTGKAEQVCKGMVELFDLFLLFRIDAESNRKIIGDCRIQALHLKRIVDLTVGKLQHFYQINDIFFGDLVEQGSRKREKSNHFIDGGNIHDPAANINYGGNAGRNQVRLPYGDSIIDIGHEIFMPGIKGNVLVLGKAHLTEIGNRLFRGRFRIIYQIDGG